MLIIYCISRHKALADGRQPKVKFELDFSTGIFMPPRLQHFEKGGRNISLSVGAEPGTSGIANQHATV